MCGRPYGITLSSANHWRSAQSFMTSHVRSLPDDAAMPTSIQPVTQASPGPRAYRAFYLGSDGRVRRAEIIEAGSDDEALSLVAHIANAFGIDLWERARYLAHFPPSVG